MIKIWFAILLIIGCTSYGQNRNGISFHTGTTTIASSDSINVNHNSDSFRFEKINQVQLSQKELFTNAQTWITKTFGNYKSVVQFEDKENGKIIIKAVSNLQIEEFPVMKYIVTIDVRENRYRFIISDLEVGLGLHSYDAIYNPINFYVGGNNWQKAENAKLRSMDKNSMSKKEIRELDDKLKKGEELVSINDNMISSVRTEIKILINSLNLAMNVSDDFK